MTRKKWGMKLFCRRKIQELVVGGVGEEQTTFVIDEEGVAVVQLDVEDQEL